jgi:hypothetical protein
MKPTSYRTTPQYTQDVAAVNARFASGPRAVNTGPEDVEAAYYQQGISRAAQLGYLGLQKDEFETNLGENKRQFDVSMEEGKREFSASMGLATDRFKYMRRQNNRAELLGMVNVGLGIGMGFQQYKQNKRLLEMMKNQAAILQAQRVDMETGKK